MRTTASKLKRVARKERAKKRRKAKAIRTQEVRDKVLGRPELIYAIKSFLPPQDIIKAREIALIWNGQYLNSTRLRLATVVKPGKKTVPYCHAFVYSSCIMLSCWHDSNLGRARHPVLDSCKVPYSAFNAPTLPFSVVDHSIIRNVCPDDFATSHRSPTLKVVVNIQDGDGFGRLERLGFNPNTIHFAQDGCYQGFFEETRTIHRPESVRISDILRTVAKTKERVMKRIGRWCKR